MRREMAQVRLRSLMKRKTFGEDYEINKAEAVDLLLNLLP
jgi:hypothetical protein